MKPFSYAEALQWASEHCPQHEGNNPRMDAEILLSHLLDKPRSHIYAWPDRQLTTIQHQQYVGLVEKRRAGMPIAYITGTREFWSLTFKVNPSVLIPRPDTEVLVEQALKLIPADSNGLIADLGAGSGAIAAAIGLERPKTKVIAVDNSAAALATARENFLDLGAANVEARPGSWCDTFKPGEQFRLIVSNPPYIPASDPHLQQSDLRSEPPTALAAGADGLDAIREICLCAPKWLCTGGYLMFEHGLDQGEAVRELLLQAGLKKPETKKDLENRDRLTFAQNSIFSY